MQCDGLRCGRLAHTRWQMLFSSFNCEGFNAPRGSLAKLLLDGGHPGGLYYWTCLDIESFEESETGKVELHRPCKNNEA